jgi:hypothetical protein
MYELQKLKIKIMQKYIILMKIMAFERKGDGAKE